MKIAIIGGGILGLSAAYYLAKKKQEVWLFEKNSYLGGLSSCFNYNGLVMEKYHHFVSHSDIYLNELLRDLNISSQLKYQNTQVGYFLKDRLIPFTTPLEILAFPEISIFNKVRLGLSMYSLKYIKNWLNLENISAKEWLIKYQGKEVYDKIWKHLMEFKFKGNVDQTPMSWLWSRSVRRMANRDKNNSVEKFGYLKDSFNFLIETIEKKLIDYKVNIYKNTEVYEIINKNKSGSNIKTNKGNFLFNKIIVTTPLPIFTRILKNLPKNYLYKLSKIGYKNILNATILTRQKLSPYFWLNISDCQIPFPGIIEFGNLKPKSLTKKLNVIYIPNYLSSDDEFYKLDDKEIKERYVIALKKIYPNFDEKKIEKILIFRDQYADPLYSLNYSSKIPDFRTPIENVYLCNTSQIYPETRSVNNSIKFGKKIVETILNN